MTSNGIFQNGNTHWKPSEEQPCEDLEEAAEEYEKEHTYQRYDGGGLTPEYNATLAEAFIAGAEWQKEQMLKEAVEGKVVELGETYKDLSISVGGKELNEVLQPLGVKDGDKVKVVIIPEKED